MSRPTHITNEEQHAGQGRDAHRASAAVPLAVGWIAPGQEPCMRLIVLLVLSVNVVAIVVAALRAIACDRRERAFWRAYDDRGASKNDADGPWVKGPCS